MNIKQRSAAIIDAINALSDEEFSALLVKAGIEKCPIANTTKESFSLLVPADQLGTYGKQSFYSSTIEPSYSPDVLDILAA